MEWILLLITIVFEVAGTISMKMSEGLTRPLPTVMIFVCYGICFSIFTLVLKKMDLGLAYAIWSGTGTLTICVLGIVFFGETLNALKVVSVLLIVLGLVGVKLSA
ncbi:small multidrug resistance pump [Peribacillus cavernae]|nr:small multidrug resistance pump [Peribacillus cavernae]